MRNDKKGVEEQWLGGLKRALVKHGVTVDKIAGAIAGALDAERMAAGGDGEAVNLGPHHGLRLKAVSLVTEIYAPRRTGQLDATRPILNVQAGAKVQLVFFGKAIEPIPEAPEGTVPSPPAATPVSDPLTAQLIRSGRILPSGEAVKPAAAKTEASKGLPAERKAPQRGEGWLK